MATSAITPDKDAVVAEVFIAAPPSRVFEAITIPDQLSQWWGQKGIYRVTERQVDFRPGGKWLSAGVGDDGTKFSVEGEYLEIDPPRRLVHTWIASWSGSLTTVVRWELEPQKIHGLHPSGPRKQGTGTLLKVRQEGFARAHPSAVSHAEGWKYVLGWLLSFVENGETIETRLPASKA